MAKIGVEVEGRYKGLKALFCDAKQVKDNYLVLLDLAETHKVQLVYISDNDNVLNYTSIGSAFVDYLVTLDVTRVRGEERPYNLNLMLRVDHANSHVAVVDHLEARDQVKFEVDRRVLVFPVETGIRTKPEDFIGDVEV